MVRNDELINMWKEAVVIPIRPVLELARRNRRMPLKYTSRFSEYAGETRRRDVPHTTEI
jgi:hypothetical protein